jgi:hypothetical protein
MKMPRGEGGDLAKPEWTAWSRRCWCAPISARCGIRLRRCDYGVRGSVGAPRLSSNLPGTPRPPIESKTNFIGGAKEGSTVIATATPVHRGRRTQVWQTRLETEDGKLVAVVTQTQMVL